MDWVLGLSLFLLIGLVGLGYRAGYNRARDIRAVIDGLSHQAGVVELDRQGRVLRVNARARTMFEELAELKLPADSMLTELIRATLHDPPDTEPREVLLWRKRRLLCRTTRIRTGILLTLEDLTAEEFAQRVKDWLPVAQKLAHGIKNPLTTVTLTAQHLAKTAGDERSRSYAGNIEREARRLRRMTDNFMRFTRFDRPELKPTNLNRVVQNCVYLLDCAESIRTQLELAEDLPMIPADKEQLRAIADNLVENALAAMAAGGELTITTRAVSDETGKRWAELKVADTGHGIKARYLDKVFEPYFTSKEGGTGLGMVIVRKAVEEHGGNIRLESTEGKGTTATVLLPIATAA